MQVVEIAEFGGPEVMRLVERADAAPGPGEVAVEIHATSVNPADWKTRRGTGNVVPALPHVLGRDFSGVVVEAGDGARFGPGDAVFGVCTTAQESAYATRIVISDEYVAAKPDNVSHVEAAAMALAGHTAMAAVIDSLKVRSGERVLIQGGAGGVGTMAVQLARHIGAEVGATARAVNHGYVKGHGAGTAVDYTTEDVAAAFGNCDAVLDCVGAKTAPTTFAALRPGGRAAFIATGKTPPPAPSPEVTSLKPDAFRSRERIERLAALIADGTLRPPEIVTLPLSDVARAHELSETGHVRGKIVLLPRG